MVPYERQVVEGDFHQILRGFDGLEARWTSCFQSKAVTGVEYQHDVNSFLRVQLGALSFSTIDARLCLEDIGDYKRWLGNLVRHVVPLLQQNQLPISFKEVALWPDQRLFG